MNKHATLLLLLVTALLGAVACGGKDKGKGTAGSGAECEVGAFGNVCDPVEPLAGSGGAGGSGGGGSSAGGTSAHVGGSGGGGSTVFVPDIPEPPACDLPAPANCPAKVVTGDVDANDQAAIDALEGVTTIEGGLSIYGGAMNLDALHCLREVKGDLNIERNSELKSFDALRELESVAYSVDINGNSQADIGCGLMRLKNVGADSFTPSLDFEDNGMRALRLPALESGSQLRIRNSPQLALIEGPDKLTMIGQFFISDNPMLERITGFEGLTSVSDLVIADNPALPVCDALLILDRLVKNKGYTGLADVSGNLEVCP